MPKAAPLVITPEQERAAWAARRRPDWPATFELCMADGLLRRLVHAHAVGMAQAARDRATRAARPEPAPALPIDRRPPPAPPACPARPLRQAALFDPKRRAAGDTDDD